MATITLRSVKGSPLTNAEVDANFSNINDELATKLSGTGGITVPSVTLSGSGGEPGVATLTWNDTAGTLDLGLKGGNVTMQIGEELFLRVTNSTGSAIPKGSVVYITSSTGSHVNVVLSQANSEGTSSKTLGITAEAIANAQTGFVATNGIVSGLDTSALTEGGAVWLSATVAGGLTSTRPSPPNHAVLIGWCVKSHASVGALYIHIANGYEVAELHDVLLTSIANNQVLSYESASGLWKNRSLATVANTGAFSDILSTPTTLSGYGITDAPTVTGTGASGTWGISITGNAATATRLINLRTINGVGFDGTADITIADSTKLPLSGGTLTSTTDQILTLNKSSGSGWNYIGFSHGGTRRFYFGLNADFEPSLGADNGGTFRVLGPMTVGGSTVLTAANYNSYALPLTGGTITGTVSINGGGSQPLNLTTSSSSPWGFGLTRSDANVSSRVFLHNGSGSWTWVYEHNPVFYNGGAYSPFLHSGNYSSYALPLTGGTLSGTLYFADNTNGLYRSSGRLTIRSESTDNVANFAAYGLYLPVSGQTAGLYVESPIEARGGLRMGNGAGAGTITVGADTAATANRLVQRDSGGDIYGRYFFGVHFNQSSSNTENPAIAAFWTNSGADNYNRKSSPAHVISQLGLLTTSNYTSYAPSISGGSTIGGITYFSNGESINLYGIRGRFTNEYIHLYNKVGVGNPSGWGQGEGNTPNQGLSTYGGINVAYGTNDPSTFNGTLRVNGNTIRQGNNLARPIANWSAGSTSTGMVIFKLPGSSGNYGMVHMVFDIYEYNSNAVSTVIVGGHNWSSGWYNVGANIIGQCGKEVRLGYVDGQYCVVFGTGSSTWEYGTIILRKIHNASFYDNTMDMGGAFTASQVTSASFTNITGDLRALRTPASFNAGGAITQAGNQVLHAGNYNSYAPTLGGTGATGTWGINITGNAATSAEAQNNYFYVRGTSPSVLLVDTDQGETRYVHHNGGSIGFLNSGGNWVLRCDNSTTYGTFSGSLSGNASTASNVAASGITGQTGMWTSAARPGPYRLYRNEDDSAYNVQTTWSPDRSGYWSLRGYYNDSYHAPCYVAYSGYADSAGSVSGGLTTSNYNSYAPTLTGGGASGTWGISITGNAATLQGYEWNSAGKDVRGSQIYVDNWFRNYNSGTGLYNEATANHWYSDGQYWNVGYAGTTGIRLRNGHAGTILGYLYAETSGNFGLLHNGGGWAVQVYPGGGGNLHGSWAIGGNTPLTSANYTNYSPPYSGGTLTGTWYFTGNGNTGSSSSPALQAYSTGGNGAYMSFHRGGHYAVNMGLDSDNVFRIGGWSASANRLQMDMSGNLTMAGLVRAGTNFYADQNYGHGLVGVYASTRYQGVFAMGDSYKLPADGTSAGNLYGIAWSYPSAGGVAGNLDSHGLLVLINGGLGSAISYSIVAAGNVTAYSDERLKTNWRPMPENFVERLAQVKSGIYDRIDGEQITQVGIGAQSFQKLLPEAITKAKDEMGTLSVSYGNAAMASAVELAKEIVAIKRELEALKARLH